GKHAEIGAAAAERRAQREAFALMLDGVGGHGVGSLCSHRRRYLVLLASTMLLGSSSGHWCESMPHACKTARCHKADLGGTYELDHDRNAGDQRLRAGACHGGGQAARA